MFQSLTGLLNLNKQEESNKSFKSITGAVPLLAAQKEKVIFPDKNMLNQSKSFVGLIGPPGAGKSSLCNTMTYCQLNEMPIPLLFEPSDADESFTKGLWMLSKEVKSVFPIGLDWEVLDMEGTHIFS